VALLEKQAHHIPYTSLCEDGFNSASRPYQGGRFALMPQLAALSLGNKKGPHIGGGLIYKQDIKIYPSIIRGSALCAIALSNRL